MAATVYLLCTVTALICCVLLFRGYRRSRARLLFWSGLCFTSLAAQNLFLFLDLIIFPKVDLSAFRLAFAVLAVAFLLYGLIWKGRPTDE